MSSLVWGLALAAVVLIVLSPGVLLVGAVALAAGWVVFDYFGAYTILELLGGFALMAVAAFVLGSLMPPSDPP